MLIELPTAIPSKTSLNGSGIAYINPSEVVLRPDGIPIIRTPRLLTRAVIGSGVIYAALFASPSCISPKKATDPHQRWVAKGCAAASSTTCGDNGVGSPTGVFVAVIQSLTPG